MIGLVLMILLSALATIFPATLGPAANPLQTPEIIKPEWFFYVAFRWLKLFTGTAAILSMGFVAFRHVRVALHRRSDPEEDQVPGGLRLDRHPGSPGHHRPDRLGSHRQALRHVNMTLETKRIVIASLGGLFLLSLVFVQWMETARKAEEAGLREAHVSVPAASQECVDCHAEENPGIVTHWTGSTHAETRRGVPWSATRPWRASPTASSTTASRIATVVTPRDCARCHDAEEAEFAQSHHAAAGNILASLDNFLAETVEGARDRVRSPLAHARARPSTWSTASPAPTPAASSATGPRWRWRPPTAGSITVDDLQPDENGIPTNHDAVARIALDENGKPHAARLHLAQHRHRPPEPGRLQAAPAPPATAGTTFRPAGPGSRRTAASATWARTILRRRSTRSPSTASPSAT